MSIPVANFFTEFFKLPFGSAYQSCLPVPVKEVTAEKNFSRVPESMPEAPSRSTTATLLFFPVASPIFAFGHLVHHPLIVSSSVVASRQPLGTSEPIGSLLPGRQGNTAKPSAA